MAMTSTHNGYASRASATRAQSDGSVVGMADECVVVLTTTDSAEAADELAHGIVDARLGACAQIVGPIRSVYRWEGSVQVEQEWQCLVKTTAERLDELTAYIKAHHSYDVPEIIATPIIGGSAQYLSWVRDDTKSATD